MKCKHPRKKQDLLRKISSSSPHSFRTQRRNNNNKRTTTKETLNATMTSETSQDYHANNSFIAGTQFLGPKLFLIEQMKENEREEKIADLFDSGEF